MTDIGPGTPLICIRRPKRFPVPEDSLTVGALYTCRLIIERPGQGRCINCDSRFSLKLREKDFAVNYCECLFRPLNDGDTSLVDAEERHRKAQEVLQFAGLKKKEPV
jgi:hypothetical protein